MYTSAKFEFTAAAPAKADATIDKSIRGKQQLLGQIAKGLGFPDYFGGNWDALIDCLSDLTWSQATEMVVDHDGIPDLPSQDLRLYLESLSDAADRRAPEMLPRLRILFRNRDRAKIAAVLGE